MLFFVMKFPLFIEAEWKINENIEMKLLLSNAKNYNRDENIESKKIYTSTYRLQQFYEQENGKYCSILWLEHAK